MNENLLQLAFIALVLLGLTFARLTRYAPDWEARWSRVGQGSAFLLGGLVGCVLTAVVLAGAWRTPTAAAGGGGQAAPVALPSGPGRGLFQAKGCPTCHTIAGLSQGTIGPELTHVGSKAQIAGVAPMNHDELVKWLRNPPGMKPGTQ
ncbi:MAG TPA: hypothetical protein VG370_03230, partial [Chloroflexota bacterium]|nr:hypothetical protein [Chloroflexota bacterium]